MCVCVSAFVQLNTTYAAYKAAIAEALEYSQQLTNYFSKIHFNVTLTLMLKSPKGLRLFAKFFTLLMLQP